MGNRFNHQIQILYANAKPKLLANLTSFAGGDLGKAEDALQEAFIKALAKWPEQGVPNNPAGWIFTTAKRKIIDQGRHEQVKARKLTDLQTNEAVVEAQAGEPWEEERLPDERLELLFTCCHPLLSPEGQIALTLHVFSGMGTEIIARALMVSNSTMAKRLTRAKAKIRENKIPFELPAESERDKRLAVITQVIYLIFNEGYLPKKGTSLLNASLCDEAIELVKLLNQLYPKRAEVTALWALMLFAHSRRKARFAEGRLVILEEQDRGLWDTAMVKEATGLIDGAMAISPVGEYQILGAVASLHANAASYKDTDWPQIALLYERLLGLNDTAVVRLNHAVAVAMAVGPEPALALLEKLEAGNNLQDYHLLYSTKAEILAMLGLKTEALASFDHAVSICDNEIEKEHMRRRMNTLG